MSGFSKLEKSLKYLCLRKVQLWPRFHVDVTKSLEGGSGPADVVELCQRMTPAMERIQAAILEVIDACIQELGRSNAAVRCRRPRTAADRSRPFSRGDAD